MCELCDFSSRFLSIRDIRLSYFGDCLETHTVFVESLSLYWRLNAEEGRGVHHFSGR